MGALEEIYCRVLKTHSHHQEAILSPITTSVPIGQRLFNHITTTTTTKCLKIVAEVPPSFPVPARVPAKAATRREAHLRRNPPGVGQPVVRVPFSNPEPWVALALESISTIRTTTIPTTRTSLRPELLPEMRLAPERVVPTTVPTWEDLLLRPTKRHGRTTRKTQSNSSKSNNSNSQSLLPKKSHKKNIVMVRSRVNYRYVMSIFNLAEWDACIQKD